jgi:hypothetical protein
VLPALTAVLAAQGPAVQDGQDAEAERRSALLRAMVVLKIAPYLTSASPRPAGSEFRIAVVGSDLVTAAILKHLPGKKVDEATVRVLELPLARARTGESAASYDLLFLSSSVDAAALPDIVRSHANKPVPVFCERPGFAALGGGVQLFVQDNGIRFEVNSEALRAQGIKVPAQLQKLSRKGPQ